MITTNDHCPCGTDKTYLDCCGVFISQQQLPNTPEALMRSRYTAYQQRHFDYIMRTMKSPAADDFDVNEMRVLAEKINWTGLQIVKSSHEANKGMVEFLAYYTLANEKNVLHEISEFICDNGQWYYVDGTQPNNQSVTGAAKKMGRNALCPCGSMKKYKKCCGLNPN